MTEHLRAGATVALRYGRGTLRLALPVAADVIRPRHSAPLANPAGAVAAALVRPLAGPPLRDLVPSGARVGVSVCDMTRPFPSRLVLPIVLDAIPDALVTVFIASGTHRACTPEELDAMLGPAVMARVRVVQHDAFDAAAHTPVGVIPGSTTVAALDAAFLAQDVRITLGFIEPHFFAGFSGGPKMVAPGLAALDTVLELHSAVRVGHPNATFGVLAGNPLHEGIAAVAERAGVAFSLDVTLNDRHEVTAVYAGSPWSAHADGCDVVRETAMERVAAPYDIVVTTNSGYPLDQNLYQAVKGICAAAGIVRDGGAILLAAECADGLPAHGRYRELLERWGSPAAYLAALAAGELRAHDQWQVQKQALVLKRARVLVHAGGLTSAQIQGAWFEPASDLTASLADLVAAYGPGCRVAVLPEGPQSIAFLG